MMGSEEAAVLLFKTGDQYCCRALSGEVIAWNEDKQKLLAIAADRAQVLFIDSSFRNGGET